VNLWALPWQATYIFSKTNKMVVNTIAAQFQFKNGDSGAQPKDANN
jgi:hypothetical protein